MLSTQFGKLEVLPIANGRIIAAQLQALLLPSRIALVHHRAYTKKTASLSLGNDRADVYVSPNGTHVQNGG